MELMTTTCPACDHVYRPAKSKRVQTCPNCESVKRTGASLREKELFKHLRTLEAMRKRSAAKQAEKPKPTYVIPARSKKGAKQEREVKKTKTELKRAAMDGGFCQCEGCGKHLKGLDGSHIIPLSQSSALAADPANITLLCRGCHNLWEYGDAHEMIELRCFVRDMRYMFRHDNARFWNIHYRLLEEYNLRPTPKLERVLGKLEKFEQCKQAH